MFPDDHTGRLHMPPITRRTLSSGLAGLIGSAAAAEPASLRGTVHGDEVTLPPLDTPADISGKVPALDPFRKRAGIAIIGLGRLALTQILPGFAESRHVRVTALVSGGRDKARIIAAQYRVPETNIYDYTNFDAIKNNPDVDIVYIVLPNALHAEYTIRAAQAGKHVLCEKPMATSVADAQRMIDACKQAKRKLMIAYRCQYLPEYRTLISLARGTTLGKLRLIEATNGQNNANDGQWRLIKAMSGGGSLPDVGLYCLNAARFITGEEPVEISARTVQPQDDPRFTQVEDLCSFTLRFPSGVLATCASGYSYHENRFLRLMGSEAWAGLDPAFSYDNLTLQIGRREGQSNALEQRRWSPKNQFALEMDAFAEAIAHDRVPLTPGEEGIQDMRIMQAIYQSAASGSVVKIPPMPGLDVTRGPAPPQED
jgi:predicted dehydrogenase